MLKLMPLKDSILLSSQWIESFQSAISLSDTKTVHLLLHEIPQFQTIEDMKTVLLLSMDAENMLCTVRQELVAQRTALASQFLI